MASTEEFQDTLERVETSYGPLYVSPSKDRRIYRHLKEYGAQQRGDLEMIMGFVPKDGVVVDVGAHIGTFAIPLAQAVGPGGRVFAFEGSPDTFSVLERNVAGNNLRERMVLRRCIVGDGGNDRFQMKRRNEDLGTTRFSSTADGDEVAVALDSLIDQIAAPALIKIDVEGMELAVLRGAQRLMEESKPVVFFETNAGRADTKKIANFLHDLGYSLFANIGDRNARNPRWHLAEANHALNYLRHQDLLAVPDGKLPFDASVAKEWGRENRSAIFAHFVKRARRRIGA